MEPTQRFSDRVHDYTKFRPSYPPACLEYMQQHFHLGQSSAIADIGSGTGILTGLLLNTGATVYAIEPNDNMRMEAEKQLQTNARFISRKGTGESSGLEEHSIDLVTIAQAFHWMDADRAKAEFRRVLKPLGHVAILWNIRSEESAFAREYEDIKKRYGKDYTTIRQSHEPDLQSFFLPKKMRRQDFRHFMLLNESGLHGQLRSSSFMPKPGDPQYPEVIEAVQSLFHQYQENGLVKLDYVTQLHHD